MSWSYTPTKTTKLILTGSLLLALVVVFFWQVSTRQPEAVAKIPVRVAVSTTPLSAPLYIADELGYFQQCGLDVSLKDVVGGKRSFQHMLDGDVDLSTSSDSVVAFAAFEQDFQVLLSFSSSDNDVKIIHRRGVDLATAKGIRIGYVAGSASEYLLQLFQGLSKLHDESTWLPFAPSSLLDALVHGEIDAMVIWEPFSWLAVNQSEHEYVVADSLNLYSLHFDLISRSDFLTQHPEINQRFHDALSLATLYIQDHPADAKKRLIQRLGVSPDFIDWIWDDYFFAVDSAADLLHSYAAMAGWFMQEDIVSQQSMPDFSRLIAPTAAEPAFNKAALNKRCPAL